MKRSGTTAVAGVLAGAATRVQLPELPKKLADGTMQPQKFNGTAEKPTDAPQHPKQSTEQDI